MNTTELRSGFKAYMQKRFPNDSNISATVSMAFFMGRNSEQLGMNFQEVLSSRIIPSTYKDKLEVSFEGSKNPRGRAAIYERSLRLLLEYLDGKSFAISDQSKQGDRSVANESRASESMRDILKITTDDVNNAYSVYVRGHYDRAEMLLRDILADPLFKHNTDERVVALKIGLIDTLYSTNLNKGQSTTSLPDLARAITCPELRFDDRVLSGDISVVAEVLRGARNNFSFVSKYCKIHEYYLSETDNFAIYDSVVSKNLFRFLPRYGGITLREHTPQNNCFQKRDYALWCDYINKVIEINGLHDVAKVKRKLDWYIWGMFNQKEDG